MNVIERFALFHLRVARHQGKSIEDPRAYVVELLTQKRDEAASELASLYVDEENPLHTEVEAELAERIEAFETAAREIFASGVSEAVLKAARWRKPQEPGDSTWAASTV